MSKALEAGRSMLDGILAKLPENLRAAASTAFLAPEAADALTELGARGLAQSEFSRVMDELREKETTLLNDHEKLSQWWNVNEGKVKQFDTVSAELAKLKGTPTTTTVADPPPPSWGKDDIDKQLDEREQAAARYLNAITQLSTSHLHQFGEVLNVDDLAAFSQKGRVNIFDGYKQKFAEKIAAKAKEADDARVNAIVEERFKERMRSAGDPRFPTRAGEEASVLDALTDSTRVEKHTVDSAAALYDQLSSARS